MKRSRIGPKTFKEALERALTKRKANESLPRTERLERSKTVRKQSLKAKSDPKLVAWSKKVRARDGNECKWPGIADYIADAPADFKVSIKVAMSPCATGDRRIDAHHKAKKSQRPDLVYVLSNGVSLCRTHHQWTDDNHDAAVAIGLLDTTSYEAAQKERREAA